MHCWGVDSMKYYVIERPPLQKNLRNAANKARADVEIILEKSGYTGINLVLPYNEHTSISQDVKEHISVFRKWKQKLGNMKKGDIVLIQYPPKAHSILSGKLIKSLKRQGIVVIFLIHDLDKLRFKNADKLPVKKKLRIFFEDTVLLKQATFIISHNQKMTDFLVQNGVRKECVVNLDLFDYIIRGDIKSEVRKKQNSMIIAGNLDSRKVQYLDQIDKLHQIDFELFGVGYKGTENPHIHYHGSFMPDELPKYLSGGFGLVWDGTSIEQCAGIAGEYLKYNNPHKMSLYLSCGFPVVVWKKSAVADFVMKNHLGIAVENLLEAQERILEMTELDYENLCESVREISWKLQEGFFLTGAIQKIEKITE